MKKVSGMRGSSVDALGTTHGPQRNAARAKSWKRIDWKRIKAKLKKGQ